jgi:hypothetical protein
VGNGGYGQLRCALRILPGCLPAIDLLPTQRLRIVGLRRLFNTRIIAISHHYLVNLLGAAFLPITMASSSSGYIAIRDDASLKSLSNNERSFLQTCAFGDDSQKRPLLLLLLRGDGREATELRSLRLMLHRWDNGAACTVQWGQTRITSTVSAELMVPNPDRESA